MKSEGFVSFQSLADRQTIRCRLVAWPTAEAAVPDCWNFRGTAHRLKGTVREPHSTNTCRLQLWEGVSLLVHSFDRSNGPVEALKRNLGRSHSWVPSIPTCSLTRAPDCRLLMPQWIHLSRCIQYSVFTHRRKCLFGSGNHTPGLDSGGS